MTLASEGTMANTRAVGEFDGYRMAPGEKVPMFSPFKTIIKCCRNLLKRMAKKQSGSSVIDGDIDMNERADELRKHIERMKSLLVSIAKDNPKTAEFE